MDDYGTPCRCDRQHISRSETRRQAGKCWNWHSIAEIAAWSMCLGLARRARSIRACRSRRKSVAGSSRQMEKNAARVLPQRADEGDPERTRRRGWQGCAERTGRTGASRSTKSGMPRKPPSAKANGRTEQAEAMMPAMSAEATVVRNYLDWLTVRCLGRRPFQDPASICRRRAGAARYRSLTGSTRSRNASSNISPCSSRVKKLKGPILCLVGPLRASARPRSASSIAEATNRKFVAHERSVACATRPRFAAIAVLTSVRCRAR